MTKYYKLFSWDSCTIIVLMCLPDHQYSIIITSEKFSSFSVGLLIIFCPTWFSIVK